MKLADKIRYLREVEGNLRGLGRAMTQQELVRAIHEESGATSDGGRSTKQSKNGAEKKTRGAVARGTGISQSYLSQIESGARPHLTNTTRLLLAKFFKVHPGYLVDDPEGYQAELMSDARYIEDKLDLWLVGGAERFRRDPALCAALLAVANHNDSRRCLLLLKQVLETPGLVDRLCEALRPRATDEGQRNEIAKPEQASKARLTAEETATTSLQANDGARVRSTMRSEKGAARRTRK
jgi:transcriptional regulator with XRE-family HTH domain